jgi:hypothetical protein
MRKPARPERGDQMFLVFCVMGVLSAQQPPTPAAEFEDDRIRQLMGVRRIYVDKLTGVNAEQIRDLLMSSLQGSRLFIVTENSERADATLRGTAEDHIFTESFSSSDGIDARVNSRTSSGSGKTYQGDTSGISVGDRESRHTTERKHEAVASLRLVNKDGDVIWSTTQESRGAKFRGAAADVADKVSKQLTLDFERARRGPVPAIPGAILAPRSEAPLK